MGIRLIFIKGLADNQQQSRVDILKKILSRPATELTTYSDEVENKISLYK